MKCILVLLMVLRGIESFEVSRPLSTKNFQGTSSSSASPQCVAQMILSTQRRCPKSTSSLHAKNDDDSSDFIKLRVADQEFLGAVGVLASGVVLYSEYTLKQTGCGLPAGPAGILGAVEGLSYLYVVGLTGFSLLKKFKTGSGLPAGPGGVLGAADGLSFLAVAVGLVVLVYQILDYGYIPNAVPMEGGMCK